MQNCPRYPYPMDVHPTARCALLADPYYPVVEPVRGLLETLFEAVFVVADARSLLEGVQRLQPSVAVLDLTVAGGDLSNLIIRLKKAGPETALIALTVHEVQAVVESALAAGLHGVVLKRFVARDLLAAVDAVLRQETFVTAEFAASRTDRASQLPGSPPG